MKLKYKSLNNKYIILKVKMIRFMIKCRNYKMTYKQLKPKIGVKLLI